MKYLIGVIAAAAASVGVASAQSAQDGLLFPADPITERMSINEFLVFPGAEEVGEEPLSPRDGASTLLRSREGIGYTANTRGLLPGGAYTNWLVLFNRPDRCEARCACDLDDLFFNPSAEPGFHYLAGRVADEFGQASFTGKRNFGEIPQGENQAPLPVAPQPGAEFQIVVREHGLASTDPDILNEQLTEFDGGCPPNECGDVQVSVHRSPTCLVGGFQRLPPQEQLDQSGFLPTPSSTPTQAAPPAATPTQATPPAAPAIPVDVFLRDSDGDVLN